jgi:hypothetical protein
MTALGLGTEIPNADSTANVIFCQEECGGEEHSQDWLCHAEKKEFIAEVRRDTEFAEKR